MNLTKIATKLQGTVKARHGYAPTIEWCNAQVSKHASKAEGLSNRAREAFIIGRVMADYVPVVS